ncbi:MAG: hypothetical protein KDA32_09065 [Phycisphaerales bacterium]|nr:hypothetical protein [Phycisphaerales bacterium]
MEGLGKKITLIVIAVAALTFAGVRACRVTANQVTVANELVGDGFCLACRTNVQFVHPKGEEPPHKCPACNERAVYRWYYCSECHRRFIPRMEKDIEGTLRPVRPTYCAACGCENVGPYYEGFVEVPPIEDVEPPPSQ